MFCVRRLRCVANPVTNASAQRAFLSMTRARLMELNPSKQMYSMEHAYEEPTLRFMCDGYDVDFKNDIRSAIKSTMPRRASVFTEKKDFDAMELPVSSNMVIQQLRALANKHLVSFAEVQSTPRHLCSFFETLATYDVPTAVIAADHFTFAGLVATHGASAYKRAILDGVDSMSIVGTIAHDELIAEGTPYNTEARYDIIEKCFVLRGTGKFNVVAAAHADWAIVTATLTTAKQENRGTFPFLVQLREDGKPLPGVSAAPIKGESAGFSGCGLGILHFDSIRLPREALLRPHSISDDGTIVQESMPGPWDNQTAMEVLQLRRRLATGSVYLGAVKRQLTNVVRYVAQGDVVGPDGKRNYPLFGLQHVQTPVVSTVAKAFVYLSGWQQLLPRLTSPEKATGPPPFEDAIRLAGVVFFLQETLMDLDEISKKFMGVHGVLHSTGNSNAIAAVQMRREGVDSSALIREVAYKSVARNVGTTHWGWWLTGFLERFGAFGRFVRNPFYSPRIADLGRHLMFFSHKHYSAKKRLRESREIERRKGGSEHQWYDWYMFRHREVVHCGEALMEMYFMETMMNETQKCADPRGRKILRDLGWIYALVRQVERLDYHLAHKIMSPGKAVILLSHLDNLVTVLAPQCVNLVDAMQVPVEFRAPCAADDIEPYWTIPGTNTGIQRGDKITLHEDPKSKNFGNTKEEQESMQEEPEEFDLLHGLEKKKE